MPMYVRGEWYEHIRRTFSARGGEKSPSLSGPEEEHLLYPRISSALIHLILHITHLGRCVRSVNGN